jgi:hypothetical protein
VSQTRAEVMSGAARWAMRPDRVGIAGSGLAGRRLAFEEWVDHLGRTPAGGE